MRAVLLDVPESFLEARRRSGADRWDEMWEGVLHMVPQPTSEHQGLGSEMHLALGPVAKAKGLRSFYETALYRKDSDYRVPDLSFVLPSQVVKRGIEGGAELVIEILSPDDESHEKLPWYAAFLVKEVLIIDPETRALEFFVLRGGQLHAVVADEKGQFRSAVLGVTFATREGPKLEISGPLGTTLI